MLLISHRGNLSGPDKELENNPKHLEHVMQKYCVEIDLRIHKNKLYLGHDECQYEIKHDWLCNHYPFLWIHCKNAEALEYCSKTNFLHYFWHNTDDYTITSLGYVWAYPGKINVGNKCISVMPELFWQLNELGKNQKNFRGICTDFCIKYDKLENK